LTNVGAVNASFVALSAVNEAFMAGPTEIRDTFRGNPEGILSFRVHPGGVARAGWWVLTAAGVAELGWLVVLGLRMQDAAVGLLLRAGDRRAVLTAVATAALLLADGWLDTSISGASPEALVDLALEVPLAAFCLLVTRRAQLTNGAGTSNTRA
jgi:hypothetical protein